jgi:hypothetical protein
MGSLEDQLYRLYTASIYPVLLQTDPEYERPLANAGMGWKPTAVPTAKRASFEQEMKMQSWLAAREIKEARSLAPETVRAKLLIGPVALYRVNASGATAPPYGIWWFTEKVAQRCRDEAGPDSKKRLEWLRQVLAVCFNWSSFDRIQRIQFHACESIPVVMGRGVAMPHYKVVPHIDRKTGERVVPDPLPPDYWKKKGEMLLGGELQIVLPWIPVLRIVNIPSL